ncbi:MAG: T9SS type A sorting domain-containing protein [Carboxylicivirga sp.]|jgi:hypothetical protein|nr:T9SS type A sorting domain-containing protein [Carboxylicivirga sp.]
MKKNVQLLMAVLTVFCSVSLNAQNLLSEDFSGESNGAIPDGWVVNGPDEGPGQEAWGVVATGDFLGGDKAPAMRLTWNPTSQNGTKMRFTSPAINTSSYSALEFKMLHEVDHYRNSGCFIKIETTSDDGVTWNEVYSKEVTESIAMETLTVQVQNDDVGSANFKIAVSFHGSNGVLNSWIFDDISLDVATATAINEETMVTPVCYPNPATDIITISNIKQINTIGIYSLTGVLVKEYTISSKNELELNVSDLSSGIYLIKLEDGQSTQTIKFNKL